MPVHVLATLLLLQLPVDVPEKVAEDSSVPWVAATQVENSDEACGFRLI